MFRSIGKIILSLLTSKFQDIKMKTANQWKSLLNSINFPNFNKTYTKEILEFVFTNCKQRDALLTWLVIQLGADFKANKILKHHEIMEYLKQRQIIEEHIVEGFVNATISKEEQERAWDKLFNVTKMQRRLMPQLYDEVPSTASTVQEDTNYNETFLDLSKPDVEESFYKELHIFKKLRRVKPSEMEEVLQSSGDFHQSRSSDTMEETAESLETTHSEGSGNEESNLETNKVAGQGDVGAEKKSFITEKTTVGTWYNTTDGLQKIFVPIGAPPIGELDFDLKKVKIVCEESSTAGTEKDVKTAKRLESMFRRLQH